MTETPAAAGERRALVGFFNQFDFAARVVLRHLREIDTIRVADPSAGAADDFQFSAGGVRYALQVKWADVDPVFQWSQFTKGTSKQPSVISKLASAWKSLRASATTPLYIYLVASGRPGANQATSAGLGASTTSEVKSFAKFYYTSFQPLANFLTMNPHTGWADVEQRAEVATWKPFWKTLQDKADLDGEFVDFVRALRFEFGAQRPDVDGALIPTDYRDEQSMARLFEELVVDPSHPVELTKRELLDRLDWLDRTKYRNSHHFALPLAYGRNQKALDDLEKALDSSDAGYLALLGPAGTGKSTVLSDFNPQHSRVVRYYAYVPESPDPRSVRGEAENFLHDVTVALNSHYRAGNLAPTDLRGLRERLQRQLEAAHQEFVNTGVRTIVIIDGLDHIPREQNPSRSLLEELPGPAALREGVFLLLGTQTCSVVPDQSIIDQLSPDRQIQIPALSADEVLEATRSLGLLEWLTPVQISLIEPACEGHPLALTYLLADLAEVSFNPLREELASRILEDSSQFGGDLDKRYARYVQAVPADDQEVIRILAVAARFRTSLDLDWFATWADPSALDRFERATTPFFFREDRRWRFMHNSFRRYLAEYTSDRRGVVDAAANRAWHLELAELCRLTDEKQWRYIADEEVAHRYFGGDLESLVATCTPSFLRSMLEQLRPISVVEDHLQLTIEAAADCNDSTALAALLLFRSELGLRRMTFDTDHALASTAVDIDPSLLGVDHALRGRELRTDARTAAALARALADRGMQDAANDVLAALGGLPALRDFIEHENRDWQDVAQDWCASLVAAHGIDIALADLDHSIPAASAIAPQDLVDQLEQELAQIPAEDWKSRRAVEQRRDALQDATDAAGWTRDFMHLAAVKLAISERDDARATAVTERFDAEASPDFCVAARALRLEGLVRDGAIDAAEPLLVQIEDLLNDLEGLEDDGAESVSPNLAIRLRTALVVLRHWPTRTNLIDALIPERAVAPWPSVHGYVDDLSDFETAIRAITLGLVSPTRVDGIGIGEHRVSPALDRIERGLVELCKLELACDVGDPVSSASQFRSILGMPDHHPKASPGESVDWTNLKRMAPELTARLLNKYGEAGDFKSRDLLLSELNRIWTDPDLEPSWNSSSRIRVIKSAAPFAPAWAADHLRAVELTLAEEDSEPYEKASNWLATASAWGSVPNIEAARGAMRNAVVASLGVGTHESDEQLEVWPDWLSAANPDDADFRSVELCFAPDWSVVE